MAVPIMPRNASDVRHSAERLAPQADIASTAALGRAFRRTILDPHAKRDQIELTPFNQQRVTKRNKGDGEFYPGSAYQLDLVNRAVSAVAGGESQTATARQLQIAPSTVHKYVQRANNGQALSQVAAARVSSGLTRRKMTHAALV